jgi:hypothetical protein
MRLLIRFPLALLVRRIHNWTHEKARTQGAALTESIAASPSG